MENYSKNCFLFYSRLLSPNSIGNIAYSLQIKLIDFGLLNVFLASPKKSFQREFLFKKISQKFEFIHCRSYKFGRELKNLSGSNLILDIPSVKEPQEMNKEELYLLMWSLVFCKFVERKTKETLKSFLPYGFPVK